MRCMEPYPPYPRGPSGLVVIFLFIDFCWDFWIKPENWGVDDPMLRIFTYLSSRWRKTQQLVVYSPGTIYQSDISYGDNLDSNSPANL